MREYWARVAKRAWRRSLELVRWESRERVVVFLVGLAVPFAAVWYFVGDGAGASVRALASIGGSAIAVLLVFGWSLLRLPALMDSEKAAELAKLKLQQDTAEDLKQKRLALGRLLADIEQIKLDCHGPEPVDENALNDFNRRARQYVHDALGEDYVHRFASDAGTPSNMLAGGDILPRNANSWGWANKRAYRLHAFLEEVTTGLPVTSSNTIY